MNEPLYNILLISICFLFIMMSLGSLSSTWSVVVDSLNSQFTYLQWNPYEGLCVVYFTFAIFNFFVPSLLTVLSTKQCLILSNLVQIVCFMVFIHPIRHSFIIVSAVIGMCQSVLWVANGKFLIENSTDKTIDRNVSIFWAIHQVGSMLGSAYVYYEFLGVQVIDESKRINTYITLISFLTIALILLLFLRNTEIGDEEPSRSSLKSSPIVAFKTCLSLLKSKQIALLSIPFVYTGLQQSFYMSIYPTVVAYTQYFAEDTVKYIGIFGILCAAGEIIGSVVFNLLGKRFFKDNRPLIYLIGFCFNLITYVLVYLSHPNDSVYKPSHEESLFFQLFDFKPDILLILVPVAIFLGISDCIFNTQIIALLGTIYSKESTNSHHSSSAYALYKFLHAVGASITFLYASFKLTLDIQLIILITFTSLNMISFYLVNKLYI